MIVAIAKSDPQQELHHVTLDDPGMENIHICGRYVSRRITRVQREHVPSFSSFSDTILKRSIQSLQRDKQEFSFTGVRRCFSRYCNCQIASTVSIETPVSSNVPRGRVSPSVSPCFSEQLLRFRNAKENNWTGIRESEGREEKVRGRKKILEPIARSFRLCAFGFRRGTIRRGDARVPSEWGHRYKRINHQGARQFAVGAEQQRVHVESSTSYAH